MIRLSLQTTLEGAEGPFTWHVAGDIPSGQLLSVHGPSGAGKTTLLRTLAGLLKPEQGRIQVGETVWYDQRKGIWLPPQKRKIGYLFQDLALFPHLSVIENVRFAMEKSQPKAFAEELLEAVGLTAMAQRKPQTLSGGQQQRVALARALARKPDLLLLDEPLSALDDPLRHRLRELILELHRRYQLTTVLVSHDLADVYTLAQQVWMLENGEVVRRGSPHEVFTNRRLSGKYRFTGTVLALEKADVVYLLSVLVGQDLVKLVASEQEAQELAVGDRIIVASKAFNPVIMKVE